MANANEMLIKYQVATTNLAAAVTDKEIWEVKLDRIGTDLENWSQAKTLLELLKNHKLEKRKDFILSVINSAMRDIFQEDYKLDILPRVQRGKSAAGTQKYDIIFYQNGIEIAKNDDLLSSNGGGVLSIASLFFKILIGYLYSGNKFYIFDESLSQVSPQYRMRLSTFLREFCDKYGFTLVVVSQTEELEIDAHLVYEVDSSKDKNGVPILEIVHQEGELPEDGFFYSSIENFQSIVKQNFVYKGFTVIRGPNNSGKSATLRSIEAILFNSFQVDNYPRLNPGGKTLVTEVLFGYVPTIKEEEEGKEQKEIGLIYKGKKVLFVINGKEYFGKSLASDKLKEAVEEIGFKYIDVKKLYKNFKGDLKEQTERIAYTNQYDGLFLIGSKTTDSEKIFSFLFNTENIALAIAQAKEAMLEMNKNYKEYSARLIETETSIRQLEYQIDYYNKKYYVYLINEMIDINEKIANFNINKQLNIDLIEFTSKLNKLYSGLYSIDIIEGKIEENNILDEKIAYRISTIKNIQKLIEDVHLINYYLELQLNQDNFKNYSILLDKKINLTTLNVFNNLCYNYDYLSWRTMVIEKELPTLEYLKLIYEFIILDTNQSLLLTAIDLNKQQHLDLSEHYGLHSCDKCSGSGVVCSKGKL